MKKYLYLPILMTALFVQGCGNSTASSNSSLTTFLSLHNTYCSADYSSPEQLITALETDPSFKTNESYDGIYEKVVSNISYAISPEEGGCTTDVKIKRSADDRPQFSFEQINAALLAKGYKPQGEKVLRDEVGLDDVDLKVLEQKYISPENVISTLVFPLENEDQYYMTFFAEKFEIQGASLKKGPSLVEI